MALVGTPTTKDYNEINRGYEHNPMRKLAEQFRDVAKAGLNEQVDLFNEPVKFFSTTSLKNQMHNFFIRESFDPEDPKFKGHPEAVQEHVDELNALFNNDISAISEAAPLGAYNPVVGITFPMHKNLLMTTVFDKGAIPKAVAVAPQFTLTMETRTLYSPDGREIDMFLEQNKIKDIVESSIPRKDITLMIPEMETTDVLALLGAVNKSTANISRSTKVTKVIVKDCWITKGEEYYDSNNGIHVWDKEAGTVGWKVIPIQPISFSAHYGQYDREFNNRIDMIVPTNGTGGVRKEIFQLSGTMHKNKFTLLTSSENVKGVVLSAALDVSSAAYETPKVKWSARTDFFEIPEAPHITVTISPEETRDIQAMYNVNQLTKLMSMIKLTLVNYKDDKILEFLDQSFLNLPNTSKVSGAFNFVPPDNFLGSHVTWRYETFMDYLDTQITTMLQVLNDENMTVTIFGRPELIRKITPKEYTYTTPPSIGPVMLDYKKTVKTSDNRVYQFISSNKLRNDNNLIILLCPRNSTRVMYKIFDYQLYVGNEIRDTNNYQLPAVTAFERFLFIQYQPVQGRIRIVNPTGLKEDIVNEKPVDRDNRALNDYTANRVDYKDGAYLDNSAYMLGTAHSAMNIDSRAANEYTLGTQEVPYAYPSPNYATDHPENQGPQGN